ncbi:hypothetical protein CXB38_22790 [Pseudomonas syringae]|nr:hypothetical protein CXB35_28270 [Pseudomonas syringae]POP78327.1 hypothetical protein CXB38_22790 [Pseudomonas syringae]
MNGSASPQGWRCRFRRSEKRCHTAGAPRPPCARVQCCAFFCETVLFNAPGHPPRTLQFCCATSAAGSIPSQNKIDQVAIE